MSNFGMKTEQVGD